MVNTYAKKMNSHTNPQNNLLYCKGNTCELVSGDGTKRIYQKIAVEPTTVFYNEYAVIANSLLSQPEYYHLVEERLPSGNHILFSYDHEGLLKNIEMKNKSLKKELSWMRFSYEVIHNKYFVKVSSSDEKCITYTFEPISLNNNSVIFALTQLTGSHLVPTSYEYIVQNNTCLLKRKNLPLGQCIEMEYDTEGRVKAYKKPNATSGKPETVFTLMYGDGYTDVFNAQGLKRRFIFDSRKQLVAIEQHNKQGLFRVDRKFWEKRNLILAILTGQTIEDGQGLYCTYIQKIGNMMIMEMLLKKGFMAISQASKMSIYKWILKGI